MKLKADFINDWIQNIKKNLITDGYDISKITDNKISTCYFNAISRKPEQTKRNIILSDVFTCPDTVHAAWDRLNTKILTGEDLSSELSKNVSELLDHDSLMNDWDVHYFQLKTETKIIVNRVFNNSSTLLAVFTSNTVFVINIYESVNWDEKEILEIIHRNWPFLIERSKIETSTFMNLKSRNLNEYSEELFKSLTMTEDGSIYSHRGGGIVEGGCNSNARIRTIKTLKYLKTVQDVLENNISIIVSQIPNYSESTVIEAKYVFEDAGDHIYFPQYNFRGVIDPKKWN